MKKICFFNHFHNGDIFNSKPFVMDIMNNVQTEFYYAHNLNHKIISDLDIRNVLLSEIPIPPKTKLAETDACYFINTWIGAYFEPDGECTLKFSYSMYEKIYLYLGDMWGIHIKLKPIEEYWPTIDFTKFDVRMVDSFVKDKRLVLISNGPAHSNQCVYNGDMKFIIEGLADMFPHISFVATQKFITSKVNIFFTDDIIKTNNSDLNEISYLSTYCDIIIGRSSGPFSFCLTKNNVYDEKKTFYCFGDRETDCFFHGTPTKAHLIFSKYETEEKIFSDIKTIIGEKTHVVLD